MANNAKVVKINSFGMTRKGLTADALKASKFILVKASDKILRPEFFHDGAEYAECGAPPKARVSNSASDEIADKASILETVKDEDARAQLADWKSAIRANAILTAFEESDRYYNPAPAFKVREVIKAKTSPVVDAPAGTLQ